MKKTLLAAWLCASAMASYSQNLQLDTQFGNAGTVKLIPNSPPGNIFSEFPSSSVSLSNNRTAINFKANNTTYIIVRNSDGTRDLNFGENGINKGVTNFNSSYLALQPDGKLLLGGYSNGSNSDFLLYRFNTNGVVDSSFGQNGSTKVDMGTNNDLVFGVSVQPDGKILLSGAVINNNYRIALLRVLPNGIIDNQFGVNGKIIGNSTVDQIILNTFSINNKLVAVGANNGTFLSGSIFFTKFNLDGSTDNSFGVNGTVQTNSEVVNLKKAVLTNNKIAVLGQTYIFGENDFYIARFNEDGSFDQSFNGIGYNKIGSPNYSTDEPVDIITDTDNSLIVAGRSFDPNNPIFPVLTVAKISNNGVLDQAFGLNGISNIPTNSPFTSLSAISKASDGTICLTGSSNDNGLIDLLFGYISASGVPINSIGNSGLLSDFLASSDSQYSLFYIRSDQKILTFGFLGASSGYNRFLRLYNTDGTLDISFGNNGMLELDPSVSFATIQNDNKIYTISTEFGPNGSTVKISRLTPNGSIDPSWGINGSTSLNLGINENAQLLKVADNGNIYLLGGYFGSSTAGTYLVKLMENGSIDNSFGLNGIVTISSTKDMFPSSLTIDKQGNIYILGLVNYMTPDFQFFSDAYISKLNSNGIAINTFGQNGITTIDDKPLEIPINIVALDNQSIIYSYLDIPQDGSSNKFFIEKLDANGQKFTAFGNNSIIEAINTDFVVNIEGKIINYGLNETESFSILKRFNSNGSVDVTFGQNGTLPIEPGKEGLGVLGIKFQNDAYYIGGFEFAKDIIGFVKKYKDVNNNYTVVCPSNITAYASNTSCNTVVNNIDPSISPVNGTVVQYTITGATVKNGTGSASGNTFNKGVSQVKYFSQDDPTKLCTFTVTVLDTTKPLINNLTASISTLWPANHKMINVGVNYTSSDNCGIASTSISITSNEPVLSNDKEDKSPDWFIINSNLVQLRAERLESGKGRVYTITVTVIDVNGNSTSKSTFVFVPKNQGNDLKITANPNPSSGPVTVTVNSENKKTKITLRLMNDKGLPIKVYNNLLSGQSIVINEFLRSGIYYLEAQQDDEKTTIILIKQ